MKSRIIWALVLGAASVVFRTTMAGAQSNDSTRGYDGRALRFESYLGNVKIIRGADGPVVGTVGWFRDFDVEKLVATSPSAQAEARVYKRNNFRGSVVASIGGAATAIGIVVAANNKNNASTPILIIGGLGAMAWGAQHLNIACSALSRSLWWYNRDVTRSSQPPPATGRPESATAAPRS